MDNDIYSKETLNLYREALNICDKLHDLIVCFIDSCKYVNSAYCKAICLQEQYNVVNLQTLQPLDFNLYIETERFCIVENKECRHHQEMECDICLLETLVRDPYIKFIKKEC